MERTYYVVTETKGRERKIVRIEEADSKLRAYRSVKGLQSFLARVNQRGPLGTFRCYTIEKARKRMGEEVREYLSKCKHSLGGGPMTVGLPGLPPE